MYIILNFLKLQSKVSTIALIKKNISYIYINNVMIFIYVLNDIRDIVYMMSGPPPLFTLPSISELR